MCFAHYLISYAEMGSAILCIQMAGLIQSGRESSKTLSHCAAVLRAAVLRAAVLRAAVLRAAMPPPASHNLANHALK